MVRLTITLLLLRPSQIKKQFLSFSHSHICHPRSSSSQPISFKIDQFVIRDLHLTEKSLHHQDITTFRDIIDDSVDEFKSTKDTIQLDDSDSESEEDIDLEDSEDDGRALNSHTLVEQIISHFFPFFQSQRLHLMRNFH